MLSTSAPDDVRSGATGTSWLCRDDFDRQRMLDMEERVRPVRQRAFAIMAVALVAVGPWLGWWPVLFLVPAAIIFGVAEALRPRVARPEFLMFAAWIGSCMVVAGAVWLTGGPRVATLSWLAIPVITLSSRFSMRGVVIGVVITTTLTLAVAFGVDASYVLADPVRVVAPITLILSVAVLSTPLMHSDIEHRSDAVIDQLTGMLNRKALTTRADELAQQSQVSGEPVGVIVADIDRFKNINDSRGHVTGDYVLKDVAYLMRKQLRAFDLAYRLGGEEFLILLPGADVEQASELAERLRQGVSAESVAGGVTVTMSFGVGASRRGELFDYAHVFAAADAALYRAKKNGRDQVCVAGREPGAAVVQIAVAHGAAA